LGRSNFLFAWAAGVDSVAFSSDLNKVNMTRKVLLIVKAVEPTQEYDSKDTNTNIGQRIVCMEISKPILESLHSFSTVSTYSLHIITSGCTSAHKGCSRQKTLMNGFTFNRPNKFKLKSRRPNSNQI
jgi:hypothetical protein